MTRTSSRIRPLAWLWSGAVLAPVLVLSACSGKVSLGGNGTTMQAVSTSDVNGAVGTCPSGSAHPNVCCTATAGAASTCGNYPGAPFQACETGYQTYPDPRSCCDLAGTKDCAAASAAGFGGNTGSTGSDAGGPVNMSGGSNGSACVYACPVGYYPDATGAPGVCCTSTGANVESCMASASEDCPVCGCPACPPGAPCAPCDCPPATPNCGAPVPSGPPQCDACPSGWMAPEGTPGLCCRQDTSTGEIECFSQAVAPPAPSSGSSSGNPTPVSTPPSTGIGCSGRRAGRRQRLQLHGDGRHADVHPHVPGQRLLHVRDQRDDHQTGSADQPMRRRCPHRVRLHDVVKRTPCTIARTTSTRLSALVVARKRPPRRSVASRHVCVSRASAAT